MHHPTLDLTLDVAANRLIIHGRVFEGRRRWEAVVLAVLIAGNHRCAVSACSADKLDAQLARSGQAHPLTRKQWGLIWQSIRGMFDAADLPQALSSRLFHLPRNATVGPWWWSVQSGDRVAVEGVLQAVSELVLPQLTASSSAAATAALCRQMLVCQSLISEGQLNAAHNALVDKCAWVSASPELHALRLIRLVEVHSLRRAFQEAEQAIAQARLILATSQVATFQLDGYLKMAQQRMAYIRDPIGAYNEVLSVLYVQIYHPERFRSSGVDNHIRGQALNLAALCERRWIEQHAQSAAKQLLDAHAQRAMSYWSAALFGFLACSQHVQAHNICSNIAYMFQRMCELKIQSSPDHALTWYALSQAWHNRFDLPDDTIWEYIFIGDFWLARQDVRQLLRDECDRFGWAGQHPAQIEFYSYAMRRAQEIGDPRQLAHAALNFWRYGQLTGCKAESSLGLEQLEAVLAEHEDLREILYMEGYVLPKSKGHLRGSPRGAV